MMNYLKERIEGITEHSIQQDNEIGDLQTKTGESNANRRWQRGLATAPPPTLPPPASSLESNSSSWRMAASVKQARSSSTS